MASLEVQSGELIVRLSGVEQAAAMRREVRVPLSCVTTVCADPDPWGALRGIRAPGTGIPGVVAYGVRRVTGGAPDFAALHGRGPAVRIDLAPGAAFGRIMVTVDDAQRTVDAVRALTHT
ncbi:MAG: hypothetical protein WAU75_12625 [Solirubrobacteraceae bacterium]